MNLPDAWNTTTGNDSMVMAIIDSGVQLNHPDLAGRLVPGWDFVNRDSDPSDDFGHGTMVAGIAAASTNNGQGVAGADLAGQDHADQGPRLRGSGQRRQHRRRHHVTPSTTAPRSSTCRSAGPGEGTGILQQAVNYATSRNVVVVAAAGNDGTKSISAATAPHYPAACAGVIAVGATDAAGNHSSFSSYGNWIDVVAPGEVSANPARGIATTMRGSTYGAGSGTSFSAPLVAGVAFLMRAADPNANQATITSRLIASARDLGPAGFDSVYGPGMVDADRRPGCGVASPAPPPTAPATGCWASRAPSTASAARPSWAAPPATGGATAADLEPTPSRGGYWVVDSAGHVFGFGDARYFGGADGLLPGEQVTSLSATPSGNGYWIFTTRGRVFNRGDAPRLGDMAAVALNGPILDSIPTPSGQGYYMVGSDGGIFAFGDARFAGSMGGKPLNAPVQSLVPDPDRSGYWLVASDGGVFAFDGAPFRGSMGGKPLNAPVTGMVPFGNGYLMVATDGGAFNFSDQPFSGSLAGSATQLIVGIATKAPNS